MALRADDVWQACAVYLRIAGYNARETLRAEWLDEDNL